MENFKKLEQAIQEYTNYRVTKYFCDDDTEIGDLEMRWVADRVGDTLHINDYFFGLNNMMDYERYDYSFDEMVDHYHYALGRHTAGETIINIKNYKRIKEEGLI